MAGPAASVLVRFDGVAPAWREVMNPFATDWHDPTFCWVADTLRFSGTFVGEPRPFVGSIDPFECDPVTRPYDAAEAAALFRFTGRRFTHSIVVAAMCNGPEDHRILCEIVAALADRSDGLIDFDCLDVPEGVALRRCEWTCEAGKEWRILGTASEARKWLAHPAFHMVK